MSCYLDVKPFTDTDYPHSVRYLGAPQSLGQPEQHARRVDHHEVAPSDAKCLLEVPRNAAHPSPHIPPELTGGNSR